MHYSLHFMIIAVIECEIVIHCLSLIGVASSSVEGIRKETGHGNKLIHYPPTNILILSSDYWAINRPFTVSTRHTRSPYSVQIPWTIHTIPGELFSATLWKFNRRVTARMKCVLHRIRLGYVLGSSWDVSGRGMWVIHLTSYRHVRPADNPTKSWTRVPRNGLLWILLPVHTAPDEEYNTGGGGVWRRKQKCQWEKLSWSPAATLRLTWDSQTNEWHTAEDAAVVDTS